MTLDEHWVPQDPASAEPNAYYRPGTGTEEREGGTIHFEVRELLDAAVDPNRFLTQMRVNVIVTKDTEAPIDRTVICYPGWGETSAIFTGDALDVLMEAIKRDGSRNPRFIFPNTGGRGTYTAADRNWASTTSFRAAMEDARRLPKELLSRGELIGLVSVIGHSMGYMNAWSFIEGLLEEKAKNPAAPFNLQSITGLMPATDEALGTVSPRFLGAVAKHVWPAAKCTATGKSLSVSPEDYNALMFADSSHPDRENFKRSVPDSGRVFLEWAARNFARKPLPENDWTEVRANILWAGQEALLPDKMGINEARFLRENGVKAHYHTLQNFSHAIPYKMSEEQKTELLNHWVALI